MSKILSIGTMAFDSIVTPFGKEPKILGGSVNYFSISASYFCPIQCVSVVGKDFPVEHLKYMQQKGIDTEGIQQTSGDTFFWEGSYGFDLNEAKTLATHLNVLQSFDPVIPESYRDTPFVFLGNIAPPLQHRVLDQMRTPKFVALDTMNFWIEGQRDSLLAVIARVNALIINEGELRQLTKEHNIVKAAQFIRSVGPQILIVKRGEYGALLFDHGDVFSSPGLPLAEVKDPTGAGDTFAGGFMGYLASKTPFTLSRSVLRQALVHGGVMASFTVQNFGPKEIMGLNREMIQERYQRFIELTNFQ